MKQRNKIPLKQIFSPFHTPPLYCFLYNLLSLGTEQRHLVLQERLILFSYPFFVIRNVSSFFHVSYAQDDYKRYLSTLSSLTLLNTSQPKGSNNKVSVKALR